MTKSPEAFISYASEDIDAALQLKNDLHRAGISTWVDVERLLPGQNWKKEITEAISQSRTFVFMISSRSVNKTGFVQKELRTALEIMDTIPEFVPFIIPARLDDIRPDHPRLKEIQWVDLFKAWDIGVQKIVATINHLRSYYSAIASPPISTGQPSSASMFRVFIEVQVLSNANLSSLLEKWSQIPEVIDSSMMLGEVDAVIIMQASSLDSINHAVSKISEDNNILAVKTLLSVPGKKPNW